MARKSIKSVIKKHDEQLTLALLLAEARKPEVGQEWAGIEGWVIVRKVTAKNVTYSWETGNGGYRKETVTRSLKDFLRYFIQTM